MTKQVNIKASYILGAIIFLFSAVMIFDLTEPASAQQRGSQQRQFRDTRHDHNRSYPARGYVMKTLPRGNRVVIHGRSRYYFHGGAWYRPSGRTFIITAPPFGMIVPFLPPHYATVWIGGIPYYYANDVYYTQSAGGYIVVEPPNGDFAAAPSAEDQTLAAQVFIYPRQGQSEEKQADDRYECHRWAVEQTGYDPTKPPVDLAEVQIRQKRADYQRASAACLDGRGYTVK